MKELLKLADYSFINDLTPDPNSKEDGNDHDSREVFSGHFVTVKTTPIKEPIYISHSKEFFEDLGFDDGLALSDEFKKMFSGDSSDLPNPLKKIGWATGYALSIYGTEYYDNCPFGSGNGYGDGRAISIFEGVINGKRWEFQLKGAGQTPYCRGADGRAVLRSSVREFLAQEHMHGLGIPTSRSLSLFTSRSETVKRPWFLPDSHSKDPEVMIDEKVAITTRVAPSFLRIGQLELFGRRARKNEHSKAMEELKNLVLHILQREYLEIGKDLSFEEKVLKLTEEFSNRLTSLVADWIRVGYCQGNFNSDNCAIGGFTLDYGPFGFIDMFDIQYQPWTGGGVHFSFFNQHGAAKRNFDMFCLALKPLFQSDKKTLERLEEIQNDFPHIMEKKMGEMIASKLGLETYNSEIFNDLIHLMNQTGVDYTIFFRELSNTPKDLTPLIKSFYNESINEELFNHWNNWFDTWRDLLNNQTRSLEEISQKMKRANPKYTLREWILQPAYQQAQKGDYSLIHELQKIMKNPYDEQCKTVEERYYRKKPLDLFGIAGVSHLSCSS
ncbi:MAG: protein adenylyltransferase SelO family protein [Campylobacterales bacterium]|nr:protein adenylyltransferase SelO family protein [Campylobacterales bacterium]